MWRFVLVVALVLARSAHAQVSDSELDAHLQTRREFDACMDKRLAAMRAAMTIADVDARNAAVRAIPICLQPAPLELPSPALDTHAPPSLLSPTTSVDTHRPRPVRRPYREAIMVANIGGGAAAVAGFAVDRRLGIAGAGLFAVASPAVHLYFGGKLSVAPSLLMHGLGAGLGIAAMAAFPTNDCKSDNDLACAIPSADMIERSFLLGLGIAAGFATITAVDAAFLAKSSDVYVTPTYAPSQGTAGLALGGTF